MENNELTNEMCMDVKLDIHHKRPDSLKFKAWSKCKVKIEAIKCLPCFLRINITKLPELEENAIDNELKSSSAIEEENANIRVSITVPGVSISLAASRTKEFSYGIFWTQCRRDCFIYFALDTELDCRRHMKWIKKCIKNLEIYRQVFLEQRRNSRGPAANNMRLAVSAQQQNDQGVAAANDDKNSKEFVEHYKELSTNDTLDVLGPLPQIPQNDVVNISGFSRRVSRASEIYEEIFEGSQFLRNESGGRRFSRGSIASGIYEEMKPTASNFHAIMEEMSSKPPPLPPLPPIRKRINTYETENLGLLGDIPRSNTNPESELAKKKKYINVVHNIFSGRSKRAESVSETVACSVEQIISSDQATYANDTTNKHSPQLSKPLAKLVEIAKSKRNSFSSPDLSKINFLDTFDEEKVAEFMLSNSSGEIDLSSKSLNESSIKEAVQSLTQKAESFESLNISEQIPQNFNFSACNSSSINLMGSNGAALLATQTLRKKNKIIMDMNGYCLMAPIKNNASCKNPVTLVPIPAVTGTESTSSGYSTGSYCSSNDDNNTVTNLAKENKLKLLNAPPTEDSNIYENMHGSLNSTGKSVQLKPVQLTEAEFTGNLYENLLAVKAAQELEQSPLLNALSTSTPTDSPLLNQMDTQTTPGSSATKQAATVEEEENYYQTPRKSIISVDDKIPSYYPNSCETLKTTRRKSNSPQLKSKSRRRSEGAEEQITPSTTPTTHIEKSNNTLGLRHLVNIKMRRERKENVYISSPQKLLLEQQRNATTSSSICKATSKCKKTAHKISENVYTVNHSKQKSTQNNNNNESQSGNFTEEMKEKLQAELVHLAMLQNIDFKFDDAKQTNEVQKIENEDNETPLSQLTTPPSGKLHTMCSVDEEYENCFKAANSASRLLHKYATLAKYGGHTSPLAATALHNTPNRKHHLKQHQAINQTNNISKSANNTPAINKQTEKMCISTSKMESNSSSPGSNDIEIPKKFASLPRFKKIDFSPLKLRINNVLQRNQQNEY